MKLAECSHKATAAATLTMRSLRMCRGNCDCTFIAIHETSIAVLEISSSRDSPSAGLSPEP